MFGKSKKNASDAPAPPPEKPAKSKKSSGSGFSFKQFVLQHGEKFVVALVAAIAAYMLWSGLQTTSIEDTKTTQSLSDQASSVRREVLTPHWENVLAPEREISTDFTRKSGDSRLPTSAKPYEIDAWEHIPKNRGGKRGDPALVAPMDLKSSAFIGAIALNSNRGSEIQKLPDAPALTDRKRGSRNEETTTAAATRQMAEGYDFGYDYKNTTSKSNTSRISRDSTASEVIPQFVNFASVTALVMHEQMVQNYVESLDGAPDFNPDRDSPNYLGFEVQRADVTTVKDLNLLGDRDWKTMPKLSGDEYTAMTEKWPGTADETALADYTSDLLTMTIPPILLSRYNELVDHPKIPQKAPKSAAGGSGGGGMGGYDSSYADSMSSSDYGDAYADSLRSQNQQTAGPFITEDVIDEAPLSKALKLTTYKLLRFFDFEVQPGRTYVYRVRLMLEDPNYPRNSALQPATSTMKPDTVIRVQDLQAADRRSDAKTRTSKLTTGWSAVSPPISVPSRSRLFASSVGKRTLPLSATAVYAEWDPSLATAVPEMAEVSRGSVLGGKANIEFGLDVIDPLTKQVKLLKDYRFFNTVVVADIDGGDTLVRSTKDNELTSGSEIVAMDSMTGDLIISREFDDFEKFRLLSFADDREKLEKANEKE